MTYRANDLIDQMELEQMAIEQMEIEKMSWRRFFTLFRVIIVKLNENVKNSFFVVDFSHRSRLVYVFLLYWGAVHFSSCTQERTFLYFKVHETLNTRCTFILYTKHTFK